MSASGDPQLYDQMVEVTRVYLGPAADRFIARQVQNHTQKQPAELTRDDLLKLITWIQISVSVLTEDSDVIEEYIAQLRKLAAPAKPKSNVDRARQP